MFEPAPQAPHITYAEFPFKLKYEVQDRLVTVEDSLICKYDGIEMNEGVGKYHKWKDYLASGNKRITLKTITENQVIEYPLGCPKGYIEGKDLNYDLKYDPDTAVESRTDGRFNSYSLITANELLSRY